jgi:hypothetical protein
MADAREFSPRLRCIYQVFDRTLTQYEQFHHAEKCRMLVGILPVHSGVPSCFYSPAIHWDLCPSIEGGQSVPKKTTMSSKKQFRREWCGCFGREGGVSGQASSISWYGTRHELQWSLWHPAIERALPLRWNSAIDLNTISHNAGSKIHTDPTSCSSSLTLLEYSDSKF